MFSKLIFLSKILLTIKKTFNFQFAVCLFTRVFSKCIKLFNLSFLDLFLTESFKLSLTSFMFFYISTLKIIYFLKDYTTTYLNLFYYLKSLFLNILSLSVPANKFVFII